MEFDKIEADISNDEEDVNERYLALVIGDDLMQQYMITDYLMKMEIDSICAKTVSEALQKILECNNNGSTINLIILDTILADGSTALDFLKIKQKYGILKNTLIYVLCSMEDGNFGSEMPEYGISHFLSKPISESVFLGEESKIKQYIKDKNPLPGYYFLEQLGVGTSSIVHLARDKETSELVAVKEIKWDGNSNILKLIDSLSNLSAPTIIDIIKYKILNNKLYLILEFAENGTLTNLIDTKKTKGGKIDTETIINYIAEIFLGLYILHQNKLIHRDIRPSKLLLCRNNVMKIGDICNEKVVDNDLNNKTEKLFYRAPETFNDSSYSDKADIWSCGVVLYEMIMLNRPFTEKDPEILKEKIKNEDYIKLPDNTDERLKKLLKMCMNNDPEMRSDVIDCLKLPFIKEAIKTLFDNKILNNDELYQNLLTGISDSENKQKLKQTKKRLIEESYNNILILSNHEKK